MPPTDFSSNEEYSSLSNLNNAGESRQNSKRQNTKDSENKVSGLKSLTALNAVLLSSTSLIALSTAVSSDNGFTPY